MSSSTAAEEHSSFSLGDVFTTRWLPRAPPKLMAKLEGWGYENLPDLSGRVFLVTGGNSGVGREASRNLARAGAHVIIASPDRERAEDAITSMSSEEGGIRNGRLEYMPLDLASLDSVRAFARDFTQRGLPLHALICNAAVMLRAAETTSDGIEQRWGSNFVGHFYLIHLLLRNLGASAPSRIVVLTSLQEELGYIPWDDPLGLHAPKGSDWYGPSKLALLMLGLELHRRLEGTGVDVFVTHPGLAQTDLFRKATRRSLAARVLHWAQDLFGQSAYRAALSTVYAAAEPSLQGHGGKFIGSRYMAQMCTQIFPFASLSPHNSEARSPHARYRLYEQTADALEEFLHTPLPNRLKGASIEGGKGALKGAIARGAETKGKMAHEE